jgi:branched-chain amino acid transport system ATP-binding protein
MNDLDALRDDRGNNERSVTREGGAGTLHVADNRGTWPAPGTVKAFLVGEGMVGGYGKGANILNGCTIAAEKGQIAVIVGPNGAGKTSAPEACV